MQQRGSGGRGNHHGFVPRENQNYQNHQHYHQRPSVADVVDIDGSNSALRLEPIRPSGIGFAMASPPLHSSRDTYMRDTTMGASIIMGARDTTLNGLPAALPITRPRRTSTDEIRALLQRTNMALDKIVKIRESMEPFVDFKQFDKNGPPRRGSAGGRTLSRTSSSLDDAPIADGNHMRLHPGSYSSTISEDPVGDRSTGSTESTSSTEDSTSVSELELGSSRGEPDTDRLVSSSSRSDLGASLDQHDHAQQLRRDGELSDIDDDDDDSTFGGGDEEVPPFKEARLERLKNITIAFHDGLPTEFFMALTRFLHSSVEIKTRHSRFSFFKDTFVGSDVVRDMVLTGFADDQTHALRFGHILVRLGFIEHVSRTDDQLHNNTSNFYRFTKAIDHDALDASQPEPGRRMSVNASNYRESVLSRESAASAEYDFSEASCEVHALVTDETLVILARVLQKVFEHKNKLLFYKGFTGCFLGAEAVNVIRDLRIGTSLIDAVLIGQALLDEKIIEPIADNVTTFQDRYVFYRMCRVPS